MDDDSCALALSSIRRGDLSFRITLIATLTRRCHAISEPVSCSGSFLAALLLAFRHNCCPAGRWRTGRAGLTMSFQHWLKHADVIFDRVIQRQTRDFNLEVGYECDQVDAAGRLGSQGLEPCFERG